MSHLRPRSAQPQGQQEEISFGFKYQPRNAEPSMSQLMTWNDEENSKWNYKTNNKNIINSDAREKYAMRHSKNHFISENKDQFGSSLQFQHVPVEVQLNNPKNVQTEYFRQYGTLVIEDENKLKQVIFQNAPAQLFQDKKPNQEFYEVDSDQNQEDQNLSEQIEVESDNDENVQQEIQKTDYKNVQSKLLLKFAAPIRKLDPKYEQERMKRREKRIKDMSSKTKWLPNSSFATYFGKPAFENYGRGNIKPVGGGIVYGNYLKSHNVNPHRGKNQPPNKETYESAIIHAQQMPPSQPEPPRKVQDEYALSQKQVRSQLAQSQIIPEKNSIKSLKIIKPDLINSLRFASKVDTPEQVQTPSQHKAKQQQANEVIRQASKKLSKVVIQSNDKVSTSAKPPLKQSTSTKKVDHDNKSEQGQSKSKANLQKKQPSVEQVVEEDPQWSRKFMDEVNEKKQKANRLTKKVNEVDPTPQNNENQIPFDGSFDEYNPPKNYLSTMSQQELNPQFYKNVPSQWLKRIPSAGKKQKKGDSVANIFGN